MIRHIFLLLLKYFDENEHSIFLIMIRYSNTSSFEIKHNFKRGCIASDGMLYSALHKYSQDLKLTKKFPVLKVSCNRGQ